MNFAQLKITYLDGQEEHYVIGGEDGEPLADNGYRSWSVKREYNTGMGQLILRKDEGPMPRLHIPLGNIRHFKVTPTTPAFTPFAEPRSFDYDSEHELCAPR